jgi:transposase
MSENRLVLSADEQKALLDLRDHAPKAYLRERAAALLKLAAGENLTQVAQAGLLRSRDRHTLLDWLRRYQAEGLAGLRLRAGRGRKPAFFPSQPAGSAGRG